jgi:hypothetical protein
MNQHVERPHHLHHPHLESLRALAATMLGVVCLVVATASWGDLLLLLWGGHGRGLMDVAFPGRDMTFWGVAGGMVACPLLAVACATVALHAGFHPKLNRVIALCGGLMLILLSLCLFAPVH